MIPLLILIIPLIAGLLVLAIGHRFALAVRCISAAAMAIDLALAIALWTIPSLQHPQGQWLADLNWAWNPQFDIRFHLAIDGLSLLLLMLTMLLGLISVFVSWREIQERVAFFHFNLLWIISGIAGVFMAMDLFLFYFLWELMLVPMYFLISVFGHERRTYASIKFFIFTQASGLLMLLSILALFFIHGRATDSYSFDYFDLLGTPIAPIAARWIMLGFLVAFAVKIPVFLLHTWLPDAHTEAPTAGSVILAGLLLKTGAYGMLRFVLPIFPQATAWIAPCAMWLGAAGVIYGAVLAYAQTDMKRLVAYTSVSHMGFVLIGIFAGTQLAMQGAVIEMLSHGLSTGGLFILVGFISERIHSRDMNRMGGFWTSAPALSGFGMVLALASLGLPGLGNFVGEFLILAGSYRANIPVTAIAATGLIAGTIYSLWMVQKAFHGPESPTEKKLVDLNFRETAIMAVLVIGLLWIGLKPQPFFNLAEPALTELQHPPAIKAMK